jgi:hypothetical protein
LRQVSCLNEPKARPTFFPSGARSALLWDSRGERLRRGVTGCGAAAGYVAELVANWRSLG